MPVVDQSGPRVSRETRRLLATVFLSLAALWILARLRFPEQPSPATVAPLLTQIAPRLAFEDLERDLAAIEPLVLPRVSAMRTEARDPERGGAPGGDARAALRVATGLAVLLVEGEDVKVDGASPAVRDDVTGLTVVHDTAGADVVPRIPSVEPQESPRVVLATDVSSGVPSLRPVFIGPLRKRFSALWSAEVWTLPSHVLIPAGAFLFTSKGALVGVAARSSSTAVVVPAAVLLAHAERLRVERPRSPGWLGVEVQPLSEALRAATGLAGGVVVARVHAGGPAAGSLAATDVVQSIAGAEVAGSADWQAHTARVAAGETVVLGVRRGERRLDVPLTAAPLPAEPPATKDLGLRFRHRAGIGAEVVAVAEGSIGLLAGLRPGDVITRIGERDAPTPRQVVSAARSSPRSVLLAVTRGDDHLVMALVRP